ncbi:hypothetical protein [Streptomyces sp. NPDC053079]|uniref:hypothetical protein n=1 Tax=Streptomyces sp. NPDC053079 TaxID=3365697 RepID=UPI0037D25C1A
MTRSFSRAVAGTAVTLALLVPGGTAVAADPDGTAAVRGADDGAATPGPRARVIGTLEGNHSAHSLNKRGEVVFRSDGPSTVWNAVTGRSRTLEGAPDATPSDIADDGRVVGSQPGEGLVVWNTDGTVTRAGLPPGEQAVVGGSTMRTGEDGTVVLTAYHYVSVPPSPRPRLVAAHYRWQPAKGFQQLTRPGDGSTAVALNDEGLVVGRTEKTAAAWHPDGTVTKYAPTAGHTGWTWANAVNNREVLVGGQERPDGAVTPTRWDGPESPRQLPHLGFGGDATGVNDRGWVIGAVRPAAEGYRTDPVVWDPRGRMHRLDSLLRPAPGGEVESVDAINNRNQVLVHIKRADSTTYLAVVQLG